MCAEQRLSVNIFLKPLAPYIIILYNIIIGVMIMLIREIRDKLDLSQREFAEYLGIPVVNIQHWEQGVSKPPAYVLNMIIRIVSLEKHINIKQEID